MNEQSEFLKRIEDLTELALDQENVIFKDQLFEIFPEIKDDETRYNIISDYLKEKRIGIDDKIDPDEFLNEDEKNYLKFYLEDLEGLKKYEENELKALKERAIAGDEAAATTVLNDYLINVVDIAKLYAGQGVFVDDLIGEANIALVESLGNLGALEAADEVEGFFSKICMDTMQDIIAARQDELSEDEKLVKKVNKVAKAAHDLSLFLARKVSVDELSKESGISKAMILKALKVTANKIDGIEIPKEEQNEE